MVRGANRERKSGEVRRNRSDRGAVHVEEDSNKPGLVTHDAMMSCNIQCSVLPKNWGGGTQTD